jgi:hypothetical protein
MQKKTKSMFSDNFTKTDDVCLTLNNSQKNIKKNTNFIHWVCLMDPYWINPEFKTKKRIKLDISHWIKRKSLPNEDKPR